MKYAYKCEKKTAERTTEKRSKRRKIKVPKPHRRPFVRSVLIAYASVYGTAREPVRPRVSDCGLRLSSSRVHPHTDETALCPPPQTRLPGNRSEPSLVAGSRSAQSRVAAVTCFRPPPSHVLIRRWEMLTVFVYSAVI